MEQETKKVLREHILQTFAISRELEGIIPVDILQKLNASALQALERIAIIGYDRSRNDVRGPKTLVGKTSKQFCDRKSCGVQIQGEPHYDFRIKPIDVNGTKRMPFFCSRSCCHKTLCEQARYRAARQA